MLINTHTYQFYVNLVRFFVPDLHLGLNLVGFFVPDFHFSPNLYGFFHTDFHFGVKLYGFFHTEFPKSDTFKFSVLIFYN